MSDTAVVATNRFTWADLSAKDPAAARKFYTALFGWADQEVPDPEAGGYAFFQLDGRSVAGVGGQPEGFEGPTAWVPYIGTANVDDTVEQVKSAGGTVMMEPMDVMNAGRMAVAQDPSGAVFGLWQAGEHKGFDVRDTDNAVCWVELSTTDTGKAGPFYTRIFGWDTDVQQMGDSGEYTVFKSDEDQIAGMMGRDDVPASFWLVYFQTSEVDAKSEQVKQLGGQVLVEPTDIPGVGRFSMCIDAVGASFGMLQPEPRN